jgi:hypothetical protein
MSSSSDTIRNVWLPLSNEGGNPQPVPKNDFTFCPIIAFLISFPTFINHYSPCFVIIRPFLSRFFYQKKSPFTPRKWA